MTAGAVVLSDVAAGFDGRSVLDGVDLALEPGQMAALCGGNGSGKSTLLRTIAGLLAPVGGTITVLGEAPGTQPARVGYLAQHHRSERVLPLRVVDVVRTGRYAARGLLRRLSASDVTLVEESLERTGVAHLADAPLDELSGGQSRRVYLAQALARRADVLLLDEPTAGIDAAGRERYFEILAEERARGVAVVVATHDFAEARLAAVAMLLSRRVVATGSPAEVLTRENLAATFGVSITDVGPGTVAHEAHHHH